VLAVSAILGLASLSAASQANIRPIPMSQCERDVRSWCYWYGGDYYFDYDICVSSEWLRRCQELEPVEYSTRDSAIRD
jgi:hypothetical protein